MRKKTVNKACKDLWKNRKKISSWRNLLGRGNHLKDRGGICRDKRKRKNEEIT